MTRGPVAVLVLVALLGPVHLSAKFDTALIELRAPTLASPIRTTDPRVREFDVWAGMGTGLRTLGQAEGFIADWKTGPIEEPAHGLARFDVLFYGATCAVAGADCDYTLTYVVTYVHDSATRQGYVYFPAPGETLAAVNGPSIYRGPMVEGRWFRTTGAWDAFATALIARSQTSPQIQGPAEMR